MEKTICAISTPIGVGGISIIRLSGKNSLEIVNKILESPLNTPEPRKMMLKKLMQATLKTMPWWYILKPLFHSLAKI